MCFFPRSRTWLLQKVLDFSLPPQRAGRPLLGIRAFFFVLWCSQMTPLSSFSSSSFVVDPFPPSYVPGFFLTPHPSPPRPYDLPQLCLWPSSFFVVVFFRPSPENAKAYYQSLFLSFSHTDPSPLFFFPGCLFDFLSAHGPPIRIPFPCRGLFLCNANNNSLPIY